MGSEHKRHENCSTQSGLVDAVSKNALPTRLLAGLKQSLSGKMPCINIILVKPLLRKRSDEARTLNT